MTRCSSALLIVAISLQAIAQSATETPLPSKQAYADYALSHEGDPRRGKQIFETEQKVACINCHSADGNINKAGPDLSTVGDKFPRQELIRTVLDPSAEIAVGYGTTTMETKSGEEISGVAVQATDRWTELIGADGKRVRVQARDVVTQRTSNVSLMPEGLEAGLTLEQFADLIAYLGTLRESTNTTFTPPRAAKLATFQPFFKENIELTHPVWFGELPGGTNTFVVLEHAGKVVFIQRTSQGDEQRVILDISETVRRSGATGLLGLAFHPRFRENGKYYLKYHTTEAGQVVTVLVERHFDRARFADSGSSRELLRIFGTTQAHNGGCIEFGPDGFLYLGMGDTGPQRDPQGHGQDLGLLQGKMLRLDVDRTEDGLPYAIPADNPFRNRAGVRPEIWAYGLREPWRFSFDSKTGELWVGDVGQNRIEEIAKVRAGENHGWNVFEGFQPFSDQYRRDGERYIQPIFTYSHRLGVSVTGGYVYRGTRATSMHGWYICGDFESRRVWALTETNGTLNKVVEIGRAPSRVVSFGQDNNGELYIVGYDSGKIYRLGLEAVDTTPLETQLIAATSETTGVPWRFTLMKPSDSWTAIDFDDSGWSNSVAGFGTRGVPNAVVRTDWRTTDIWLRREFTATNSIAKELSQLALRMHYDEDPKVFLNGIQIADLSGFTTGYVDLPLQPSALETLRPGRNVLAVHCRQKGGGQYIDAGLVVYVITR